MCRKRNGLPICIAKMKNSYFDLIDQSYYFPQEGFDLKQDYLTFHGISLKYLIEKYGSPFKLVYLPRIGEQVRRARNLFNRAIKKNNYKGQYHIVTVLSVATFLTLSRRP